MPFPYNLATVSDDSIITLGANQWLLNYDDTTGGSNFASDQIGAKRFVTLTAVPEPSITLLGSLSALAQLCRRRNG